MKCLTMALFLIWLILSGAKQSLRKAMVTTSLSVLYVSSYECLGKKNLALG